MNDVVREWMAKAEGDYRTAAREADAEPPNYDAVCFHAQQCIEKLLKALLIANGRTPPKTHDLVALSGLLGSVYPEREWPVDSLRLLTGAAVAFRYPGECAGAEEAIAAMDACEELKGPILVLLTGDERR